MKKKCRGEGIFIKNAKSGLVLCEGRMNITGGTNSSLAMFDGRKVYLWFVNMWILLRGKKRKRFWPAKLAFGKRERLLLF